MAETSQLPAFSAADLPENVTLDEATKNRFTEAALEQHKREGVELAVKARWVALGLTGLLLPFLNPQWEVLYYEAMLLAVAGVGVLQRRVARVGRSGPELAVLALDLTLLVFILVFPNPFADQSWPSAMYLRFENFIYIFIILAVGTLSYSWRTIMAIGNWTAGLWLTACVLLWAFGTRYDDMTDAVYAAFPDDPELAALLDPNAVQFDIRLQQIVVFVIVAGILALTVRRFNRLLLNTAALERERENLGRYFSPNVVEELSRNDKPLQQIRSHDVAAIFVDIQQFTSYAAARKPEEVIATLRDFLSLMERAVFAQGGTVDKYLGDGMMVTFGTPSPAPDDVRRAYHCARRMTDIGMAWNAERAARGEEELRISVGLHYGPAVLGDVGENRLEFAVIGNTVNIASRMEALTRPLKSQLVISDAVYQRLPEEETADLVCVENQEIRGVTGRVNVWKLA